MPDMAIDIYFSKSKKKEILILLVSDKTFLELCVLVKIDLNL